MHMAHVHQYIYICAGCVDVDTYVRFALQLRWMDVRLQCAPRALSYGREVCVRLWRHQFRVIDFQCSSVSGVRERFGHKLEFICIKYPTWRDAREALFN